MKKETRSADAFPSVQINYMDDQAVDILSHHLRNRMQHYSRDYSDIVFLCIGTDRSTGDALGPLVGSKLKKSTSSHFRVYGTLDEPVHAVNLRETLDHIEAEYQKPLIVAVDACLGRYSNVGNINVHSGPLKPGAGVKKDLPEVGVFHMIGIVNVGGFMEYFVLQNTRLSVVMNMSNVIVDSIKKAGTIIFPTRSRTFISMKARLTRS